jgi:hypothetical protein
MLIGHTSYWDADSSIYFETMRFKPMAPALGLRCSLAIPLVFALASIARYHTAFMEWLRTADNRKKKTAKKSAEKARNKEKIYYILT